MTSEAGYNAFMAFQSFSTDADRDTAGDSSDGGYGDSELSFFQQPKTLSACLEKYGNSTNVSERQVAVRHTLKALQSVEHDPAACDSIFKLVGQKFALDDDALIRAELLEQLPLLCLHCAQNPMLSHHVHQSLTPLLPNFLSDQNTQVRKTCQAAILILLEQELLSKDVLREHICPALLQLCDPPSSPTLTGGPNGGGRAVSATLADELRLEAVTLLCKFVTSSPIEREWTLHTFLPRFTTLCQDSIFHVRKVCASTLGELSTVLGTQVTETVLVPHLIKLSQDTVWGVRKCCAESYTQVSNECSMSVRRQHLAPVFVALLGDPSRWVTSQSFQSLGSFISTFADSERTGLRWVDGVLVYEQPTKQHDSSEVSGETGNSSDDGGGRSEPELPEGVHVPKVTRRKRQESESEYMADLGGLLDDFSLLGSGDREPSPPKQVLSPVNEERTAATAITTDNTTTANATSSDAAAASPSTSNGTVSSSAESPSLSRTNAVDTSEGDGEESFSSFQYWSNEFTFAADAKSATPTLHSPEHDSDDFNRFMQRRFSFSNPLDAPPVCANGASPPQPQSSAVTADAPADPSTTQRTSSQPLPIPSALSQAAAGSATDSDSDEDDGPFMFNVGSKAKKTTDDGVRTVPVGSGTSLESRETSRTRDDSSCETRQADATDQDIVPPDLLEYYISMVDPSKAQSIETDIIRHCAFNLPAVAYTLGRANWQQLKPTYLTLANDLQWKVRRTLAFSIHELAAILGPELTVQDLLPVFQALMRDLDEVRIGILKHLYDFIKLLSPSHRKSLLTQLADFLQSDNSRNWRFRHEFTRQCSLLCELYDMEDINQYLSAIGLTLAIDRVAYIRLEAAKLLASIVKHFYETESALPDTNYDTTNKFCRDIVKGFAKSRRWSRRQTYAHVCGEMQQMESVPMLHFANADGAGMLAPLLALAGDRIGNIRLAALYALTQCVRHWPVQTGPMEQVLAMCHSVQTDDRDTECVFAARRALGQDVDSSLIPVPIRNHPPLPADMQQQQREGEEDPMTAIDADEQDQEAEEQLDAFADDEPMQHR